MNGNGCTAARILGKFLYLMVDDFKEKTPVQVISSELGIDCRVLAIRPDREQRSENVKNISAMEPPMPAPNDQWLWLSPTEKAILACFGNDTDIWIPSDAIAKQIRLVNQRDLSGILRNMAERNILESQPGRGHRLKNPPTESAVETKPDSAGLTSAG